MNCNRKCSISSCSSPRFHPTPETSSGFVPIRGAGYISFSPWGFQLSDRQLKRAGLDYHEYARVQVHADWPALLQALPGRRFGFSTKAATRYDSVRYRAGDVLIFGPETRGLPDELLASFAPAQLLRLPMVAASRSLNLSNAVAVAVYEAWRQNGFEGMRS